MKSFSAAWLAIILFLVLLLLLLGRWFIPYVSASGSHIVINELLPNPETGAEWIELVNLGAEAQSLQGLKLFDQLTTPTQLFEFGNTTLGAGEFITVEVGTKLNNAGDGVVLKSNTNEVIDSTSYQNAPLGQSWARYAGSSVFGWQTSSKGTVNQLAPTPTPEPSPTTTPAPSTSPTPQPSVTPSPTGTPTPSSTPLPSPQTLPALVVSEVQSCPTTGESEWIEIYNPSSQTVTVQNWKVIDAAGNSKTLTGLLLPFQFTVLSWSGSLLNNGGDSFKLMSDSAVQVSQGELDACTAGLSWQWNNGQWQLSSVASPGLANDGGNTGTTSEIESEATNGELESIGLLEQSQLSNSDFSNGTSSLFSSRLQLNNEELMGLAPRWQSGRQAAATQLSQNPAKSSTETPSWILLWIWGGILGGGLITTTCAAMLWRRHLQHLNQKTQQPPTEQAGLSPFKWELG